MFSIEKFYYAFFGSERQKLETKVEAKEAAQKGALVVKVVELSVSFGSRFAIDLDVSRRIK